jgi:hypothetical protein
VARLGRRQFQPFPSCHDVCADVDCDSKLAMAERHSFELLNLTATLHIRSVHIHAVDLRSLCTADWLSCNAVTTDGHRCRAVQSCLTI